MPDRIAAHGVERIQNQKHLLQIASTHGSLWVRDPAVKRLDGDHTKELLDMELIDDRESFSAIVFLWAHIRFPDFAFESEHL